MNTAKMVRKQLQCEQKQELWQRQPSNHIHLRLRHFWGNTAGSPKKPHTQHSGTRPKAWGNNKTLGILCFFFMHAPLLFFLLVLEHGIFIENYFGDMSLQRNDLVKL